MILGLGTGSTAKLAVDALGKRVAAGLRVIGIPTSEGTAEQARSLGISISTLDEHPEIDLTIDGADEVEGGTLNLIKGRGGALLREKIVASASKRLVIIVDESKLVARLGSKFALPVELVPFGWPATARRLESLGAKVTLRSGADGKPYRHRWRPLHCRLCIWADRRSGKTGPRIEWHRRRCGAWTLSKDGLAGDRSRPGRRENFTAGISLPERPKVPCPPERFGVYMFQPPPNGDWNCVACGRPESRRSRRVPQKPALGRQCWLASANGPNRGTT